MSEHSEVSQKTSILKMLGWTCVILVLIANAVFLAIGYDDRDEQWNTSQHTEKSEPTSQQTNTLSQSQLLTAVGQSQRIGDILAYWWNTEHRDAISGKDYELVELAKAEILSDDTSIQFNRTMHNGGITKSFIRMKTSNTRYLIV